MSELTEGKQGRQGEKGEKGERGKAPIFKTLVTIWIISFSFGVGFAIHGLHETQAQGRHDRQDQFSALTASQISGCQRGNRRMAALINLVATTGAKQAAVKQAKVDGADTYKDHYKKDLKGIKVQLKPYYKIAHVNCIKEIVKAQGSVGVVATIPTVSTQTTTEKSGDPSK